MAIYSKPGRDPKHQRMWDLERKRVHYLGRNFETLELQFSDVVDDWVMRGAYHWPMWMLGEFKGVGTSNLSEIGEAANTARRFVHMCSRISMRSVFGHWTWSGATHQGWPVSTIRGKRYHPALVLAAMACDDGLPSNTLSSVIYRVEGIGCTQRDCVNPLHARVNIEGINLPDMANRFAHWESYNDLEVYKRAFPTIFWTHPELPPFGNRDTQFKIWTKDNYEGAVKVDPVAEAANKAPAAEPPPKKNYGPEYEDLANVDVENLF